MTWSSHLFPGFLESGFWGQQRERKKGNLSFMGQFLYTSHDVTHYSWVMHGILSVGGTTAEWKRIEITVCVCVCMLHAVELEPTSGDPAEEQCPQCPVLNRLLSSWRLRLVVESVHLMLGLPLILLPPIFPALLSFLKNPPSQDVPKQDSFSFVIFVTTCFRLNLPQGLRVHLPGSLGICRALLQCCILIESFGPYQPSSPSNLQHLYIVIGNTSVWMVLALVSEDTYWLLSLIFPSLSTAALLSLSLWPPIWTEE